MKQESSRAFNLFFYISLAVLGIIYCIGMQLDLMDIDASTYGLISKEMFHSGSYLQLYLRGVDYLDKPPLVFWSACLAFKIFGVHDWAYRLPSVLCLVLGLYSLYRYTLLFYTERAAKIAVLIMASCMATCMMTSDVRTDTMLAGFVMFSLWQLAEFNRTLKLKNMVWGAVGIACAMMAKGPIGLIVPVTAFSVEFMYKRQWKSFFRWQYLVALIVIAILLIPMSYGLYEQFDLHPEKKMYEKLGTSGLRFYYWTQSFGRITGESSWSNNPDPFFLYHSFLWTFAPWCVFFIPALFTEIRSKIKNFKSPGNTEMMSVSGFVLILIFLSRSKYQLPHYTFSIHPLAAVITANYLDNYFSSEKKSKLFSVFYGLHVFLLMIMYVVMSIIVFFIFPAPIIVPSFIILSFACLMYLLFFSKFQYFPKVFIMTILSFATLTFIMVSYFYPRLQTYQLGSYVAKEVNKVAPEGSKLIMYKDYSNFSMEFYSKLPIVEYADGKELKDSLVKGKTFILADTTDIKTVQSISPEAVVMGRFHDFPITNLSWDFLNPATRSASMREKVLLRY
ncbi:MAG TPA: glycosyltransferase family 39 protein [Bacteroidia bacterium]|nr:glycosyltransferase family 39 protein [Bacteroidia bacterium]